MEPSAIDPAAAGAPKQPSRATDPSLGEDRPFAPPASLGPREELLQFLEEHLHRPVMSAEPNRLSEEHRRRLLRAQEAIRSEMERLWACASAEEIATTLLQRIESGTLAQLEDDARFLGFRSLRDLGRDLAQRTKMSGEGEAAGEARRPAETRQELLLDEAIEETFPASDPVSVARVDDGR